LPILGHSTVLWLHLRRFECPACQHRPKDVAANSAVQAASMSTQGARDTARALHSKPLQQRHD
jgi:hypothetical protein